MNKKSFHLRWNNHLQNLQSLFENLFNEQHLVDVTISCSDGLLYGHKLVLSACSPYFEQVFKENPCKHPIIILKGIKAREMQVLLQYMYVGSVDVAEDELEILLDIATELQVKGLVQNSSESSQSSSQLVKSDKVNHSSKESSRSPNMNHNGDDLRWQAELVAKPSMNKYRETDLNLQHSDIRHTVDDCNDGNAMNQIEVEPVYVNERIDEEQTINEEYQETSEEGAKEYIPVESLGESSEDMQVNFSTNEMSSTEADDTVYFCHICSRGFQSKGSYHRHMLTHAGVKPHSCTFCEQSFLRLSHLQRHIRVHTGERPYQCSRCPKQFARSDKLRQHYILQHNDAGNSKVPKPRGRPRKNPNVYGATASTRMTSVYPIIQTVSSGVSISHVPVTNPV